MDPQRAINHSVITTPHFGGAALMIESASGTAHIVVHGLALQRAGHDLPRSEGAQRCGISDFSEQVSGRERDLKIMRIG